jgi:F1F0 ATPase subunit 2
MNTLGILGLAFLAGLALSFFYFGNLWWTVQHLPESRHPALMALRNFFLRMAVILGGFYVVMGGSWERLLVCLAGFLIMRPMLVHRLPAEGRLRLFLK